MYITYINTAQRGVFGIWVMLEMNNRNEYIIEVLKGTAGGVSRKTLEHLRESPRSSLKI